MFELSFRAEQLEAESRYQRGDEGFVRRAPLKETDGTELAPWRALARDLDKRMPRLAAALAPALSVRWERCDDLSRHLCVRTRQTDHELSLEPRGDGTVNAITCTKTAPGGGRMIVCPHVAVLGVKPDALAAKLEDELAGWFCQPVLFAPLTQGLLDRLAALDSQTASGSSSAHHARALRAALDPEGKAIIYPAALEHERVAPLLEIVRRHPRTADPVMRRAATELKRELMHSFSAEQPAQRNPYQGGLL